MLGWLKQTDVERGYPARSVTFIKWVTCGERKDYMWVDLAPPLSPGEAAKVEELRRVMLAPRRAGTTLDLPIKWPIDVYVCTVNAAKSDAPANVSPGDVTIRHWAVLSSSP